MNYSKTKKEYRKNFATENSPIIQNYLKKNGELN